MLFKAIVLTCCLLVSASAKVTVPLMTNGSNADLGEFPHQVSLQVEYQGALRHFCGGAIVRENFVVTSALCVAGIHTSQIRVKAGLNHLDSKNCQIRKVSKKFLHPDFPNPPRAGPNDLAVLKLESPLEFNKNVSAIALADKIELLYNNISIVTGWGLTEPNGQAVSPNLKKIVIPFIDNENCKSVLEGLTNQTAPVAPTNVCTGPVEPGITACKGDFGGPLIQKQGYDSKLIGIVSWGMDKCGEKTSITVYTRVPSFIDWIKEKIYAIEEI